MPGMTARDHFAAAALTGLVDTHAVYHKEPPALAKMAYAMADAMLRERCRGGGDCPGSDNAPNLDAAPAVKAGTPGTGDTDHGASPEAIARTDADRGRTDKADFRPGKGTGDTQEPVAWGVVYPNDEVAVIAFKRKDAEERATASDRVIPLYRRPPVTKPMPKEKRAEVCAEPLAWAAIRENGQPLWLSYDRSGAEGMVNGMAEVFPLYRKPTLSDSEREALEFAAAHGETVDAAWRYALRGLLERMQ